MVCVATIKALKYHGGMPKEDITTESLEYLERGMHNLEKHIDNLKNKYGLNVVVAINKYTSDTEAEINYLRKELQKQKVELSLMEAWGKGSEGATDLAQKIVSLCNKQSTLTYMYELEDSIENKTRKIAQKVYGAEDIELTEKAKVK